MGLWWGLYVTYSAKSWPRPSTKFPVNILASFIFTFQIHSSTQIPCQDKTV